MLKQWTKKEKKNANLNLCKAIFLEDYFDISI